MMDNELIVYPVDNDVIVFITPAGYTNMRDIFLKGVDSPSLEGQHPLSCNYFVHLPYTDGTYSVCYFSHNDLAIANIGLMEEIDNEYDRSNKLYEMCFRSAIYFERKQKTILWKKKEGLLDIIPINKLSLLPAN
jgi:hypothetical protein